ncbi:MAG: endolytic transglycosylase MltG, partial [Clostridiales bacterium]|nr:endolytic transglycosylase MltG [Clostridiales bacterium]
RFYIDDSAYNVTKNLRQEMESIFDKYDLYDKIKDSGFTTEEVFTLASIVQAEAAKTNDMQLVASVFINRLKNPEDFPKLQSDATNKYYTKVILPQNEDAASQAMYEDAYDTYVSIGLTPSPIGNPGIDAILAVLEAPKTDYFYFCSDINTKECFYANTYDQHKENLKKAGINDEQYFE